MYKILQNHHLNESVVLMVIDVPMVSLHAEPGQFIILRVDKDGERIPLTIADCDKKDGTVTIIFQIAGATTKKLSALTVGDSLNDFVGPLGSPTKLNNIKKAAVIGGGVGCAIAYPIAKRLFENGAIVHNIIGFKNKDLVILKDEFNKVSQKLIVTTDDGSYGQPGFVTNALENLITYGENYDMVFAVGPLLMMKSICQVTKKFNIKTTVSMNPIMIDGTGMCGGCRVTVGGKTKLACIDGPDFDGHLVDFDETISRNKVYNSFEKHAFDNACNLFKRSETDYE